MRTRWRFGLKRLFVATIEWLRLCPNAGALPQTAQTFDIGRSVAVEAGMPGLLGVRLRASTDAGPQAGEDVGHLEGGARSIGALVPARAAGPRHRLLAGLTGEDAEGHG